jgi:hypothetical protein
VFDGAARVGDPAGVELIMIVVIAAALVAGGLYAVSVRRTREPDIAEVARQAGLQYSPSDPFGCTRVRFRLFSKGDGNGAENVVWRDADDGHTYRAFDFWYCDEVRNDYGEVVHKTYHRFSCALALVGSSWPEITIVREGLIDKALLAVSGGDIDFESEEFNRLFAVYCRDRRFATALLDAGMLEVLLSTRGELNFEIKGRWLLVWTNPVGAPLVPGLLRVTERIVAAIPPVVWELYPSTFVDDHGRPLPAGDDPIARLETERALGRLHRGDTAHPWTVLGHSRFLPREGAADDDGRVEYDLDGNPVPKVKEDPWGAGRRPPHRDPRP